MALSLKNYEGLPLRDSFQASQPRYSWKACFGWKIVKDTCPRASDFKLIKGNISTSRKTFFRVSVGETTWLFFSWRLASSRLKIARLPPARAVFWLDSGR